jgi:hypothetical protein
MTIAITSPSIQPLVLDPDDPAELVLIETLASLIKMIETEPATARRVNMVAWCWDDWYQRFAEQTPLATLPLDAALAVAKNLTVVTVALELAVNWSVHAGLINPEQARATVYDAIAVLDRFAGAVALPMGGSLVA